MTALTDPSGTSMELGRVPGDIRANIVAATGKSPRDSGIQVRNKQRTDEVPLDVNDVALAGGASWSERAISVRSRR